MERVTPAGARRRPRHWEPAGRADCCGVGVFTRRNGRAECGRKVTISAESAKQMVEATLHSKLLVVSP